MKKGLSSSFSKRRKIFSIAIIAPGTDAKKPKGIQIARKNILERSLLRILMSPTEIALI